MTSRLFDLAWVLIAASVVAVSILRGGVDEWTTVLIAVMALAAFTIELIGKKIAHERVARVPRALWPLLAACVWQSALLVPLPVAAESTRAFVWQALSNPPRYAPTAINPAALALDVVRMWSILLLALVVVQRTSRGRTNVGLYWGLAAAGTVQVVIALTNLGDEGLLRASFVNPNHQAAFFNLSWLSALAASLMTRHRVWRAALLVCASMSIGATVLTLSRAGIASGALAAAVFIALLRPRVSLLGPLAIVLLGAGLSSYVMMGPLGQRFAGRAQEKTRIWKDAFALAREYPVGMGRTGFGLAFESVRPVDDEGGRWDYVENTYLQALCDYGPVGGTIALYAWAWLLWRTIKYARKPGPGGLRSPRRAAVAAALIALSAHAVFDFNWEILGIALPAWLMIASLGRPGEPPFAQSAFDARSPRADAVFLLALLVMVPAVMYGIQYTPRGLDQRATSRDKQALLDLVRTRPLDAWALVGLGELAIAEKNGNESLRWLNRAVLVAPNWSEPHVALTRLFCASKRREQALVEARLALDRMHSGEQRVFAVLARCGEGSLGDAIPERLWTHAITWAADDNRAAFLTLLAADYRGSDPQALAKLASWARRHDDRAGHDKWLAAFLDPNHPLKLAQEADAAIAEGRVSDAIQALERATERSNDPLLRQRLVSLLIAADQIDRASVGVEALAELCGSDRNGPMCRAYRMARAAIASRRGDHSGALDQYRTILLGGPGDVEAALLAAEAFEALGQIEDAVELLKRTERVAPHPSLAAARTRLMAK